MSNKQKVLAIVGPTAVGKTALSLQLAQSFHGEIISGDSMQVYRGLDIGTAKVTAEEAQGIPHYLIDCCELTEKYSVADFQKMGREYIAEIASRGFLPIVVGGTGLYIQALLYNLELGGTQNFSEENNEVRAKWQAFYDEYGKEALWQELLARDEKAGETIHPNNVRRVIRALEVFQQTGNTVAQQQDQAEILPLYDHKIIGLTTDRSLLYDRINLRVLQMLDQGLLTEAEFVKEYPHVQGAQGIGYKELIDYFAGEITLADATGKIQQNSRRYAKRQLTWFRNRMTVEWWDLLQNPQEMAEINASVKSWLAE